VPPARQGYTGHDVIALVGRAGSAYSQMEVADGRRLTTHRSCFVRFPLKNAVGRITCSPGRRPPGPSPATSRGAVNPELDYLRIRTVRDNAVYYFAKDNLNFQRLEREFKEGFGRPEWSWPKGVPKLKTIAQIFKEQGGFEVLETIKGSQLVGRQYEGLFDELPAQNPAAAFPRTPRSTEKTGVSCHRVIDGGRDSKGNPNVVAGEGTGIVHVAPGCGDVDYVLGQEQGNRSALPFGVRPDSHRGLALLPEGRRRTRRRRSCLTRWRAKHRLVNVEDYPHIYPFCWRTGDELCLPTSSTSGSSTWTGARRSRPSHAKSAGCPAASTGRNASSNGLSTCDWMISKKALLGLALPIGWTRSPANSR